MGLLHPPHLLGKLGPDLTLSKSSEKGAGTHLQGICEKADKVCRALGRRGLHGSTGHKNTCGGCVHRHFSGRGIVSHVAET